MTLRVPTSSNDETAEPRRLDWFTHHANSEYLSLWYFFSNCLLEVRVCPCVNCLSLIWKKPIENMAWKTVQGKVASRYASQCPSVQTSTASTNFAVWAIQLAWWIDALKYDVWSAFHPSLLLLGLNPLNKKQMVLLLTSCICCWRWWTKIVVTTESQDTPELFKSLNTYIAEKEGSTVWILDAEGFLITTWGAFSRGTAWHYSHTADKWHFFLPHDR